MAPKRLTTTTSSSTDFPMCDSLYIYTQVLSRCLPLQTDCVCVCLDYLLTTQRVQCDDDDNHAELIHDCCVITQQQQTNRQSHCPKHLHVQCSLNICLLYNYNGWYAANFHYIIKSDFTKPGFMTNAIMVYMPFYYFIFFELFNDAIYPLSACVVSLALKFREANAIVFTITQRVA